MTTIGRAENRHQARGRQLTQSSPPREYPWARERPRAIRSVCGPCFGFGKNKMGSVRPTTEETNREEDYGPAAGRPATEFRCAVGVGVDTAGRQQLHLRPRRSGA